MKSKVLYSKKNRETFYHCFKLANTLTATHGVDGTSTNPRVTAEKAPAGTLGVRGRMQALESENLGSHLRSSKYKLHDLVSFLTSVSPFIQI